LIIQRAGDVIPEIVGVVFLIKGQPVSTPYEMPKVCPSCGENVILPENEIVTRCLNPFCQGNSERIVESILLAVRAMNIEKVGDRLIETLVDRWAYQEVLRHLQVDC
jgi:DNA ligase (NAD+)